MPEPQLRAADTDREAVATTLGRALSEGRLAVDEYEERLATAYAARTYGELADLTTDLPAAPAAARPVPAADVPARHDGACAPALAGRAGARAVWASWITTAVIVLAIWGATSLASGRFEYFWPIWVLGPWGAVLVSRTLTGGHRDRERRRS